MNFRKWSHCYAYLSSKIDDQFESIRQSDVSSLFKTFSWQSHTRVSCQIHHGLYELMEVDRAVLTLVEAKYHILSFFKVKPSAELFKNFDQVMRSNLSSSALVKSLEHLNEFLWIILRFSQVNHHETDKFIKVAFAILVVINSGNQDFHFCIRWLLSESLHELGYLTIEYAFRTIESEDLEDLCIVIQKLLFHF